MVMSLAALGPDRAKEAIRLVLHGFTVTERALLRTRWSFWARAKQLPPQGDWRTWGFLTGRGFGKTIAISKFINSEVEAGNAPLIALGAQDEASSVAIQVLGPSGLIATASPWFKPQWEASRLELVWPNGSRAYVRTPEVPGKIRGLEYHLSWLSELQSWPAATRQESYDNFMLSTRLGKARIAWDSTPKRRHPILKELISSSESEPMKHVIVRGTTYENPHLADGYTAEMDRLFGGTQRGREELLGEMLDESESALIRQAWIDGARRPMPDRLTRRVIGIDPAVTSRAGNDKTGIVEAGLGVDGQAYILGDYSGRHAPAKWAEIVLEKYVRNGCDCVVVETNKGGELVTQNLRAHAGWKNLQIVTVGKDETPSRASGVVNLKEVHARGPKEDRAQPLATAYERGRVSHVRGVDLSALEDTITTWEPTPGQRSPDALDAEVHAVGELLGFLTNKASAAESFKGITAVAAAIAQPVGPMNLAALLGGSGFGGRI